MFSLLLQIIKWIFFLLWITLVLFGIKIALVKSHMNSLSWNDSFALYHIGCTWAASLSRTLGDVPTADAIHEITLFPWILFPWSILVLFVLKISEIPDKTFDLSVTLYSSLLLSFDKLVLHTTRVFRVDIVYNSMY